MDEYVIMNKSDLVSMADTIRDTLGSTDSIAVTDLGAKLIESIEGGGGVRVEQGSVTFAEAQNSYTFVADTPDIFIAYVEDDSKPVYSSAQYVWMIIQDTRFSGSSYIGEENTSYIFGHNQGNGKYYVPYRKGISIIGMFRSADFNGRLGAKTYKWYAIYGVTAT